MDASWELIDVAIFFWDEISTWLRCLSPACFGGWWHCLGDVWTGRVSRISDSTVEVVVLYDF